MVSSVDEEVEAEREVEGEVETEAELRRGGTQANGMRCGVGAKTETTDGAKLLLVVVKSKDRIARR